MYKEKLLPILEDIEDNKTEVAGGAVVGIILSEVNSLVKYICNLTIGKKKYLNVENEVIKIKERAEDLKEKSLQVIDKDSKILEEVLKFYKIREEQPNEYEAANKKAVEFCIDVTRLAFETLKNVKEISAIGNKMLKSDFKICSYYAFSSIESSIVNIQINLDSVNDETYKKEIQKEYMNILEEAKKWRYC